MTLEITHEDFLRETEHYMRIEERYDSERKESGGSFEDEGEYYEDDEEEYYEDDEDLLEALLGGDANYIADDEASTSNSTRREDITEIGDG